MTNLSEDKQREWATIGAKARLAEIDREREEIFQAFPELRGSLTADGGRKKRTISPAGRAAMSEGMRRYWARRKAGGKAAGKKASA